MTVPGPTRMARLKRAVATRLLALPGGTAVVTAARAALSSVRGFSVGGTRREAQEHILRGRPDLALAAHDKILAAYPHDLATRFARLQSLLRLDRVADARAECLALRTQPAFPDHLQDSLTFRLAECECRLGQVAEALRLLKWTADVPSRHNFAELMINDYADFAAADALYADTERYQREQAAWFGPGLDRTRFFPADWVRLIGHIGLLDLCVKAAKLGWSGADRLVLVAPPKLVANAHYLDYLKPFFEVTDAPLFAQLAESLGPRVACRLHLPDGSARYFCEGMGAIQEQWEREERPPLLSLTAADRRFADGLFRDLGIPPGAWVVAMHARSPGFHWERGSPHQAHRNTDIRTYYPAMAEIVRRGGWVIRLGDTSMPKLPAMPGVVDYAHSEHKSQRADVVLCAVSRFFIGCASGLCHLPVTFGVPTLLTNWCSNQLPIYSGGDRFLPKRLRHRDTGRELTFAEMLDPPTRIAAYSGTRLIAKGFEWIDNTADEILGGVREMLDPAAPPNEWVATYDRLARATGQLGFSRLANAFAAKHASLFGG